MWWCWMKATLTARFLSELNSVTVHTSTSTSTLESSVWTYFYDSDGGIASWWIIPVSIRTCSHVLLQTVLNRAERGVNRLTPTRFCWYSLFPVIFDVFFIHTLHCRESSVKYWFLILLITSFIAALSALQQHEKCLFAILKETIIQFDICMCIFLKRKIH